MSLLMKALEKAAKDREGSDASPTAAAGALELEPIAASAPASAARAAAPAAAQPARANTRAATTPRQPAQAATVISAGRSSEGGGIGAFIRERPLAVFGGIAGLAIVAYGGYVYLQLTNPGLFVSAPPPVAQIAPPPPKAPVTPPPAAQPATPLSPLTLAETEPAPAAGANATALPAKKPASAAPLAPAAANAAKAAATVSAIAASRPAAAQTASAPAPTPTVALPPAALVAAVEAPRDSIRVTAGTTAPVINPLLTEGYTALNAGRYDAAQRLYEQLLRNDATNVDALLGLAAIATQQGNGDEAIRRYLRILELDPRNAPAQAGLIGILGGADPLAAETRLKVLISREPTTAYLQFALGNAYIDQKRWPDAQQAFFQAHNLQPDNPDYAYNLAVALEHIGQPKAALGYYRRAVQLATVKGRANFSTTSAEDRVGKLEKAVR